MTDSQFLGDLRCFVFSSPAAVSAACLAQGLRQAGVEVSVYERDVEPDARSQGYRINVEPVGSRVKPWPSTSVTVLGDAIHLMPPVGGLGGNAALRDASALCQALTAVHRGESALLPALQGYEAEMIEHGFAASREAQLYTKLAVLRSRTVRATARSFFRVCGAIPPLRRGIFEN